MTAKKSILKQPSPAPPERRVPYDPDHLNEPEAEPVLGERRKSVTFCSDDQEEDSVMEEVFYADEWDRSPHQVTRKLNYSDVLELMELHMALPKIRCTSGRARSGSLNTSNSSQPVPTR